MNTSNYFQKKIVVFFIIAILMIIPNIRIYSCIGSYKIYSQAILANNNIDYTKNNLYLIEKHNVYEQIYLPQICFPAPEANITIGSIHESVQKALQDYFDNNSTSKVHPLSFKTKNYAKYDFSGFDN